MPMDYRKLAFGLGALAAGVAAVAIGARRYGGDIARRVRGTDEHVPTDLMGDKAPGPQDRAIEAFRPDPTAVPTAEEREALRPATGPSPSMVNDRGTANASSAA